MHWLMPMLIETFCVKLLSHFDERFSKPEQVYWEKKKQYINLLRKWVEKLDIVKRLRSISKKELWMTKENGKDFQTADKCHMYNEL